MPGAGSTSVPAAVKTTATEAAAAPATSSAAQRLLAGPTGLGTSAVRLFSNRAVSTVEVVEDPYPVETAGVTEVAEPAAAPEAAGSGDSSGAGVVIPPLYCPDAVRDDPALAEEVNERLVAWADEIGIYRGRLDSLRSHNFGRLMMLAHPDCDDADRLLAAAKCGLSEWSVDDHWVDEGEHADPKLITARNALAHGVVDPVRMPPRYMAQFEEVVAREPVVRAFRSALDALARVATPTQVARLRHELAVMFVGYGQEAEWRMSERTPTVWEYLLQRHENAFFPCMTLVDAMGGYEMPAHEFADGRVRPTYLLAGTASVLLNDIYSMVKEDPADTNLPNIIAAEDGCTLQEAVNRTAELHNEMMKAFEVEAAALSTAGSPELGRFFTGVWNWMGGAKEWHATSPRYQQK